MSLNDLWWAIQACEVCDRIRAADESGWWRYSAPGRKAVYYCPDHADQDDDA